jgi:hypothetical protein
MKHLNVYFPLFLTLTLFKFCFELGLRKSLVNDKVGVKTMLEKLRNELCNVYFY